MAAPNLKEIEWAIHELEQEESSEKRYELLAALYTCRNEMLGLSTPLPQIAAYSEASASGPFRARTPLPPGALWTHTWRPCASSTQGRMRA